MTKEIETVENLAYAKKSQVSLHTDNSIPTDINSISIFTCFCSQQFTTGAERIEMSTNLAYATLPAPRDKLTTK